MNYTKKSFSVGCPNDVTQDKWDKIFKKDGESKRGVLRRCEACDRTRYTWKVDGEWICSTCIDAQGGFVGETHYD